VARSSKEEQKRVEVFVKGSPELRVSFCQNFGIPYALRYTTATARLTTPYEKIVFAEERMTKRELILRNELKRHVRDRVDEFTPRNPARPSYFGWAPSLKKMNILPGEIVTIDDVHEIDINAAYYFAALQLGYIDEKMFNKCLTLPKPIRLKLLGSIASQTFIEVFDGECIEHDIKTDQVLRTAWHNIVCRVDEVMQDMAALLQEKFIFYWVDGIYYTTFGKRDYVSAMVEEVARRNNFDVKKKKLERIVLQREQDFLKAQIDDDKGRRIFTISYDKIV
jgi:hypothetical protein